jgi:hypothetical protein
LNSISAGVKIKNKNNKERISYRPLVIFEFNEFKGVIHTVKTLAKP